MSSLLERAIQLKVEADRGMKQLRATLADSGEYFEAYNAGIRQGRPRFGPLFW